MARVCRPIPTGVTFSEGFTASLSRPVPFALDCNDTIHATSPESPALDTIGIISKIMSFLSIRDRVRAAIICKLWRDACYDDAYWRELLGPKVAANLLQPVKGVKLRLQHVAWALFGTNLLQNPTFLEAVNRRCRPARVAPMDGSTSAEDRAAVAAWVINQHPSLMWSPHWPEAVWECPPSGAFCTETSSTCPPPPLPYRSKRIWPDLLYPAEKSSAAAAAAAAAPSQVWDWFWKAVEVKDGQEEEEDAAAAAAAAAGSGGSQQVSVGAISFAPAEPSAAARRDVDREWGSILQAVDLPYELKTRGVPPEAARQLLATGLGLSFSVWVTGQKGCRVQYSVRITVDHPPSREGHVLVGDERRRQIRGEPCDSPCHDYYSGKRDAPPGCWEKFTYVVPEIPAGATRVVVVLRGAHIDDDDNYDWSDGDEAERYAAYTGAKFTCAELRFISRTAPATTDNGEAETTADDASELSVDSFDTSPRPWWFGGDLALNDEFSYGSCYTWDWLADGWNSADEQGEEWEDGQPH